MVKKGQPKKKKRLKLRVNVVLKLLLFIGIVSALITYSLNLRIKNIYIVGNNTTKDVEIIEMAGIKDYPLVKNLKVKKIKNNINSLPLITNTKISINPFGKITLSKLVQFQKALYSILVTLSGIVILFKPKHSKNTP